MIVFTDPVVDLATQQLVQLTENLPISLDKPLRTRLLASEGSL